MSKIIINLGKFPEISFFLKGDKFQTHNVVINEYFNEENGDFSRDFSIFELNIFKAKSLEDLCTQIAEQFGFDEFELITFKN